MPVTQTNTLIVGASIAGLSVAAVLKEPAIGCLLIERSDRVGAPWHTHYHRLHLHTSKRFSHLPLKKFDRSVPRYPSRQQVVDYLDAYRQAFDLNPIFNTEALSIQREEGHWITNTNNGVFSSKYLVMATGAYTNPKPIDLAGIDTFPGKVLHSCQYTTGAEFKGQNVLVVGFGNSACEIALDLFQQGGIPTMAVRSPVNVVPRDLFGISVLELSYLLSPLPPRIADALSAPLMRWAIGDLTKLGLKRMPYGPLEAISRDGNPPVLDIGAIRQIRLGHIKLRGDIDRIEGNTVHFKEGKPQTFDAVVACIGYYRDYAGILHVDNSRFEDLKVCAAKQKYFGKDGLYFCGYWISPTGQIRSIAADARRIAKHLARRERSA